MSRPPRREKKGVQISAFGVCGGQDRCRCLRTSSSFDYVTMNFALMFVPEREICFQECVRVLRPGVSTNE